MHGRLDLVFEELGSLNLKNIARPVEAFIIRVDDEATRAPIRNTPQGMSSSGKPSVAVLPFENLSGDPDQQYFADGLTEDILTALTRFNQLMVIARNSTFVYKGRSVSIADVGRDLNVRYVLEGSLRRSGERVRVTAQLIEAATSAHLWAERYDRTFTDIFALQDEITERIVTTLVSNIERTIIEQARRKPPYSLGAYELLLQGREQRNTSQYEGMLAAEASFEQAVALDPGFALAYAEIAYIQYVYVTWRVKPEQRDAALSKGFANALRALSLEASLPLADRVLGNLHLRAREYADAVTWAQRAVALNPGEAESYAWLANVLSYVGRSSEALEQLAHARRLDPLHPPLWDFYIGRALLHLGRYEEAVASFDICARRGLSFHWRLYMTAAFAQLGRQDEARAILQDPAATRTYASIAELRASSRIWRAASPIGLLRACVWQVFPNNAREKPIGRALRKAAGSAEADRCRLCRYGWLQPSDRPGRCGNTRTAADSPHEPDRPSDRGARRQDRADWGRFLLIVFDSIDGAVRCAVKVQQQVPGPRWRSAA